MKLLTKPILSVSLLICGLCLPVSALRAAEKNWVNLSDKSFPIIIDSTDFKELQGTAAANYQLNGKTHNLRSTDSPLIGGIQQSSETTPFGEASVSTATYQDQNNPVRFTLILKQLKDHRAFTLQAVIHNKSDQDLNIHHFDLFAQQGNNKGLIVNKPSDWLVTPLMQDSPALSLAETDGSFKEVVLISHPDGRGLLIGPIGPAEAHTRVEVRQQKIKAYVEMDRVLVRAGQSRRSEEMIFSFEPMEKSIGLWTKWVAITHKSRLDKGPAYGWCSWYDRTTKIDEAHVMEVTKTIEGNPDVFGKGIIQIDDGYQKMDGDWSANEKFPSGMAAVAKRIREAGCTPGVWFAPLMMHPEHPWQKEHPDAMQTNAQGIASFMNANPFHPAGANWINPSHPESKKFLANIIKDARDRGFGYIKIDFNGIGNKFADPTKTRLQAFRELYALYREAAGEDMYILSCLGSPTRGVIGFIDSARVGPDSHPAGLAHCLDSVLRFQIYDKVWWHNDADVSYLAPKLESRRVGFTPQGEGMWRSWHNIVALTGGTAMISEPIDKDDVKAVWRNYGIMRPGSAEPAQLLTLGKTGDNSTFGFSATRPYGNFAVYNLYNALDKKRHINLNFIHTGLPTDQDCAVFDFWQNKVIATTRGSYNTIPLDQYSSALLRFTPLPADGSPTLIGSNLHLSMGATEINSIRVSSSVVTMELGDAGAQDGALTFFSKRPLTARTSENCSVTSVKDLGGNVWQVNVSGRKWNTAQSIELQIGNRQNTSPSVAQ